MSDLPFEIVDRCFLVQRIQYQKMHLHLIIQCKSTPELSSVHIVLADLQLKFEFQLSQRLKKKTHYIIKNVSLLKEISCCHKYASFCSAQNTSSHVHMNIYKTHLYLLLILILNSDHLKAVSGCQVVTGVS